MPIYEYRCPNGHTFEIFQRMSDPPIEVCEVCAAGPVEKLLFPVAVHFKGKGFYSTDYGRGSRGGGKDGKEGGESSSSAKESSSGDGSASSSEKKTSGGDGGSSATSKTD